MLVPRLLEQHVAPEALDVLVADRYWIEPDQMYAHDLEGYVNSCDRLGREGLGMGVCLGDREAVSRAEKLLGEYTSKVLGYLVSLEAKGLIPKGKEDRFLARVDEIVGRQLEGPPATDQ